MRLPTTAPVPSLEILLVSAEDNRPIRTALVPGQGPPRVCFAGGGVHGEIAVDDRGVAASADLPAGSYDLWPVLPDRAVSQHQLVLPAEGLERPARLLVSRGQTLRGVLADRDGQPLAGATITCYGAAVPDLRRTISAPLGDYELRGLNTAGAVVYEALNMALQVHPLEHMASGADGTLVQDVVLTAGATYFGTVTGPDGAPLPDAEVKLTKAPDAELPFQLPQTRTDANGAFELCCCPAGPMMLLVRDQVHLVEAQEEERVAVNLRLSRV